MQRVFSIILAFVFLLSSSSFTVIHNYCVDTDECSLTLSSDEPESCSCCEEPPLDNCCKKNEIQILKINDNFISTTSTSSCQEDFPTLTLAYNNEFKFFNANYYSADLNFDHDPPDKPVQRTILFRAFLI